MKKFRIKEGPAWQHPELVTTIRDVPVSLKEELTIKRPATKEMPERMIFYRAATQEDLEFLFKEGHPFVEAYDEKENTVTDAVTKKTVEVAPEVKIK